MRRRRTRPVSPTCPAPPFAPGPAGTHITIRGLTKYFAGWPLYENFDLDIPKHRIVSVFGPNGCGKSTLINMIAGLIPIDAGEILFDGKSLEGHQDRLRVPELPRGDVPVDAHHRQHRLPAQARGPVARPRSTGAWRSWSPRSTSSSTCKRYPVRAVRRPAADGVDHARAGAQARGAVPRRAVLGARLRDDAVHPREAAGGVHADRHDDAAGLARPRGGGVPRRPGAAADQAADAGRRDPALRRCAPAHGGDAVASRASSRPRSAASRSSSARCGAESRCNDATQIEAYVDAAAAALDLALAARRTRRPGVLRYFALAAAIAAAGRRRAARRRTTSRPRSSRRSRPPARAGDGRRA